MSSSLDHSPADVLRRLLISLGEATSPESPGAWPAYVAAEPASPDNVITLYDTAGRIDGRSQIDGEQWEHLGVQARVRAASADVGYVKAKAIAELLDLSILNSQVTIGTNVYLVYSVNRTSGPISLGQEPGTNRNLFTINAVVALRQVT